MADATTERLQHLLTDADGDPVALDRERVRQMIGASPPGGVLALDDTASPKEGKHSVGVAHQYSGEWGKQANCRVVVTAEYIAEDPHSQTVIHEPVSARLFLPDSWVADAEQRTRARVPAENRKQSKLEIALELVDRASTGAYRFGPSQPMQRTGTFSGFFEGMEARRHLYARAVKSSFGVGRPDEVQEAEKAPLPARKGTRGRRTKRHPAPLMPRR